MKPEVIMNGAKIVKLDIPKYNIKFRDSLNYMPSALSKLPDMFGIPNLTKGTFPHRINKEQNWDKVFEYPSLDDFGYELMTDKDKAKFKPWYEEDKQKKNDLYDFRKEMTEYCCMDVTVLRQCCQKFRALFLEVSDGIDPFVAAHTLARMCHFLYRAKMLKEGEIALLSRAGKNRKQSRLAVRFLEWTKHKSERSIMHAANGQEQKIGKFFVDGYDVERYEVHEVHGC